MKLIIQIPCLNEAQTLGMTVLALPTDVAGFDVVEYLVIDDGSTDGTADVARQHGVHHVVSLPERRGLANAFKVGLEHSVRLGADAIVNTDGDNQYNADDITKLVRPLVRNEADMIIGVRPISRIKHFSFGKRFLHAFGNKVVRKLSKLNISDAPSGFRAMSRDAALRFNLITDYTYTLETILQAEQRGIVVAVVPIGINPDLRPSRLMSSSMDYVIQSVTTLLRVTAICRPFQFFFKIATFLLLIGFAILLFYLYSLFSGGGKRDIDLLCIALTVLCIGFQTVFVAFLTDSLAANRKILEDIQYRIKSRYFSE